MIASVQPPTTAPKTMQQKRQDLISLLVGGPDKAAELNFTDEQAETVVDVMRQVATQMLRGAPPVDRGFVGTFWNNVTGGSLDEKEDRAVAADAGARAYSLLESRGGFSGAQREAVSGVSRKDGNYSIPEGKKTGLVKVVGDVLEARREAQISGKSTEETMSASPKRAQSGKFVSTLYEQDENGNILRDAGDRGIMKAGMAERIMPGLGTIVDSMLSRVRPDSGGQSADKIKTAQGQAIGQAWRKEAQESAQKAGMSGAQASAFADYVSQMAVINFSDPNFRNADTHTQTVAMEKVVTDAFMLKGAAVADMSDGTRRYYEGRIKEEREPVSGIASTMVIKTNAALSSFNQRNALAVAEYNKDFEAKVASEREKMKEKFGGPLASAHVSDKNSAQLPAPDFKDASAIPSQPVTGKA